MMLNKRVERAFEFIKKRKNAAQTVTDDEELPVEKGDVWAMTIAAYKTIVPIVILVLLIVVGIPFLFFVL